MSSVHIINNNRTSKPSLLLYDGYRYQCNRVRKNAVYWRCWIKSCRAPAKTTGTGMNLAFSSGGDHNHPNNPTRNNRELIKLKMVEQCSKDASVPPKRVYDSVCDNLSSEDSESVPTFRKQLKLLQQCHILYIDGTFKTAPDPFKQIVTISGLYKDCVIPLAFALSTGKTVGHYRNILQAIKNRVLKYTRNAWDPQHVVCDFEMSLKIAIETELPNAEICGCFFHFAQSLWRRVQKVGLAAAYQRHKSVQKVIRKVTALAFLPVLLIRNNLNALLASRTWLHVRQRHPALDDFEQYFRRTYMNAQGHFPPALWNVYNRSISTRTNIAMEGYHNKWNGRLTRHPNIWTVIRSMKDEERRSRRQGRHADREEGQMLPRRKWRLLEKRIRRLKLQYRNGVRSIDSYWDAVSFAVLQH